MDLKYLEELYKEKDNADGFVSMYDLGEKIGLDRNESDASGMQLITDGYAELVNLSGGIKISEKGITQCMKSGICTDKVETADNIGNEPVLSEAVKRTVSSLIDRIKYLNIKSEEFRIDLETLKVQFSSLTPKRSIVKACLSEIAGKVDDADLKSEIEKFIS